MSGGATAGGDRELRPAGPRSEVHQLGYDSALQGAGALQQGPGTDTHPPHLTITLAVQFNTFSTTTTKKNIYIYIFLIRFAEINP